MLVFFVNAVSYSLNVAPMRIEQEMDPGSEVVKKLTIHNNDGEKIKVKISAMPWTIDNQGKVTHYNREMDWLSIKEKEFFMDANQSKRIDLDLVLPEGFSGEKKAHIYVLALKRTSSFGSQFGVPIYIMSKKDKKIDTYLKEFKVFKENDKVYSNIVFENKGNVHVRPTAYMQIKEKKTGKQVKFNNKTAIPVAAEWPIFPDRYRGFKRMHDGLELEEGKEYIVDVIVNYMYLFKKKYSEEKQFEVRM